MFRQYYACAEKFTAGSWSGKWLGTELRLAPWRFNPLAEFKQKGVYNVVHVTWERGSVYFDDIKVYLAPILGKQIRAKRDLRFHKW